MKVEAYLRYDTGSPVHSASRVLLSIIEKHLFSLYQNVLFCIFSAVQTICDTLDTHKTYWKTLKFRCELGVVFLLASLVYCKKFIQT